MADPASLMFQVGVIAMVGFIGAALARSTRVSVIVGYIIAGMLIGPFIHVEAFGASYDGLLQESSFIQGIAQLGLVLLLFFVGLEFSIAKLARTKEAAAVLAATNLGVNLFAGFALGAWLGWPLIDTIFLAGVVSMSSSAIVAKSLIDLKRLGNAETEFLMGMVILESFLAMFLLTIVNGAIVPSGTAPSNVGALFLGVALFLGFFALLAAVVVPHTVRLIDRIKSDELFVLFALGAVFLAAAMAGAFGIPAIIGAFFMGMVFADTKIAGRLKVRMESLRDAFVAIFFVSFGMLIDPAALPQVLPMLLIAVPLVLLNDLFLTSALAYFIGFSGRAATAIGTSLVARNEEAILYASVGTGAIQANPSLSNNFAGTYLTPFTGVLCIVMSSVAPLLMRMSTGLADFFAKRIPRSLVFGAQVVRRTLRSIVMPAVLPIYRRGRLFQAVLLLYAVWIVTLAVTDGAVHLALALLTPVALFGVWATARHAFREPVRHTDYGVDGGPFGRSEIEAFVLRIVVGAFATVAFVTILWEYYWPVTIGILYAYFLLIVISMRTIHRHLGLEHTGQPPRTRPSRFERTSRMWRAAGGPNGRR